MKIDIDQKSGFCFGVVYAIQKAEEILNKEGRLYCLGDIVHNNVEVNRLKEMGLITIDHQELKQLTNCKVLIRAHGEPPETYKIIIENNIELVDASCPVVLQLQNKIKEGSDAIHDKGGQVVIYGKKGHAEVNGLVGQTGGKAIVVEGVEDLTKVDFTKPINLFSQTTKSILGFKKIKSKIEEQLLLHSEEADFISNDTVCRQVAYRADELPDFAQQHDVIVFVSGKKSSNGKMLHEICKKVNNRSYFVSDIEDVDNSWFGKNDSVGICGATSTPMWLMEKIAKHIEDIN
ncbi:MAG: 4-hydroxy-3-methylbut-2-enyl diphosphate reductase [Bacteroidales bacterium]|nr:4-hydroxy-3-methylbut-2-enyl diphosphate reductase [Bacteroidales bacterium]